jgi:hypothetical protein
MTSGQLLTLREARSLFYRDNGFPSDGGALAQRWAPFACRDLKVHLPNFRWRRRALPVHDLHHVITGYAFSPRGEFEMAAWEFAAGPNPNWLSTLFCLPLVSIGVATTPKRTFAAFVRGRRSRTLYQERHIDQLLDKPLDEIQRSCLPSEMPRSGWRDWMAFTAHVAASAVLIASPIVLVATVLLFWR